VNVFIVGGTGFLGYHATRALLSRGHGVATVALPPLPAPGLLPDGVTCRLGDVFTMSDTEVLALLAGCDGFLYAAGLDDRAILDRPAYPKLREANVDQCLRLIGLARRAGARRVVVLGSYFTHFDRAWPELKLAEVHPYIRSRREQKEAVLGESRDGLDAMILELPYIFGTMPGRLPLWTFLVDILHGMRPFVFYPKWRGGTAVVTARQVAMAVAGALEKGTGGASYPIGGVNMPWSELIPCFLAGMGRRVPFVHLPKALYHAWCAGMERDLERRGKQGGLDLVRLADIMYREAYLDPGLSMNALGYAADDVHAAIRETIAACVAAPARPAAVGPLS
jgi:dihydroflavonol-4-reductase